MKDLLGEYQGSLKKIRTAVRSCEEREKPLYNSMISDLEYVITWIKRGSKPGHKRGIERRSAYQRTVYVDPLIMQNYISNQSSGYLGVDQYDKQRIEEALKILTPREREVYIMVRGQAFSYKYTADILNVSKSTVQTLLKRADNKLLKSKNVEICHTNAT